MYTTPLAVLGFKPNFRETFCKWQTLTSYNDRVNGTVDFKKVVNYPW